MIPIKDYLKTHILVTDGAFGTYYASAHNTDELPETANITHPDRVGSIHRQYIDAGAAIIRTNTYASNTVSLKCSIDDVYDNIRHACSIAAKEAKPRQVYVAGDIGPIPADSIHDLSSISNEYIRICKTMIECDVDAIVFETFSHIDDILPAIEMLNNYPHIFVAVQFAVNQFGYSNAGLSAKKLFDDATHIKRIDAIGLNCGIGPGHMYQTLSRLSLPDGQFVTALPNAGYPQNISNRMIFSSDNTKYFADKAEDMARLGVRIIGGCCGTTPEYIKSIAPRIANYTPADITISKSTQADKRSIHDHAFFAGKSDKKLIAVELAPPIDSNDEKLMDAAHILKKSNVDVVTFPDSPSGRTRADSILMAEKVSKETGLCVMPHICCRDKNAIAMRSQILGAHINDINNFLVITGDPVPSLVRQTVKPVFNFDSVGLMNIINDMNDDILDSRVCYGGAINQDRANIDVEINRVKKKMNAGATFFMSQPVFEQRGADVLRRIKEETNARILCGIMPLVSIRNATFMKNEMTGIAVTDAIIDRYKNCTTKEEGEAVGVAIAKEVIAMTNDFVDGYYFSFPFNRVYLLEQIMN